MVFIEFIEFYIECRWLLLKNYTIYRFIWKVSSAWLVASEYIIIVDFITWGGETE